MVVKRGLPEDITIEIARLVENGSIRIAGTLLFVYFRRCWNIEEELAGAYVVKYFEKRFPKPLTRHRQRIYGQQKSRP